MESELMFSRLPYEAEPDEYGPFHRVQCSHVNEKMCAAGIIGGDRSYGVGFRRVHAYVGALPDYASSSGREYGQIEEHRLTLRTGAKDQAEWVRSKSMVVRSSQLLPRL
jgi:hypothetical protein